MNGMDEYLKVIENKGNMKLGIKIEVEVDPSMFLQEDTEDNGPDDPEETCTEDNNEPSEIYNLPTHVFVETKIFQCDMCPKWFAQSGNFNVHRRTHTGEKPYKCEYCEKGFTSAGELRTHKRIHTGERPYTCDICQRPFSQFAHLRGHKRTHTLQKPYKCDECGKCFRQSSTLKRHKLRHEKKVAVLLQNFVKNK